METAPKLWYALEVGIDPKAEDVISSTLWEEGTLGIVTAGESGGGLTLIAYFDRLLDSNLLQKRLETALLQFGHEAKELLSVNISEVPNEDWLKKWKEGYQPFTVGKRFLITPSWSRQELSIDPDRIIIEIDPGMAFGTGTHETTQLCLEAIERYWTGGRFLDVGTGTGILAIGAARLHPDSFIAACDIDAEAIMVARENAAINGVEKLIEFSTISADHYRGGRFSLVVANLTTDVIIILIDDLLACLDKDGCLVLSGILDTQEQEVRDTVAARGRNLIERRRAGEWVALIVQ
jgi:ribosomal protein L11 methyltransferase